MGSTLKTIKFRNHSKSLKPVNNISTHYTGLKQDEIIKQTGTADWFTAELKDTTDGGIGGQLYLIFNPTDSSGNAITSAKDPDAKVCYAPEPLFNSDDTPGTIELFELLLELKNDVKDLIEKNK